MQVTHKTKTIAPIASISIEKPFGVFLQDNATTMMKLDLDPNSSSKDSAEECKGAAKVSSDAGGKVGAHKDMLLATFSK